MIAASGDWVIVSGAGGALGTAITSHFSALGHRVLAIDRVEIKTSLRGVTPRAVDLLGEDEVKAALAETIPVGERIALLVNAVGMIWNEPVLQVRGGKFVTHAKASWQSVIDANLTAPFVVATQVAARMVRSGGGSIVNFSSIASEGNAGQGAYSAAKSGIEGLTRTMAIELGPLGVRVNAVALGFIDVPTTKAEVPGTVLAGYIKRTPLGRLGHVEDVIGAVDFLASAGFANGTIIKLNGGLRL
ncbi:MAG: SDR family oxidoreductase [Devosia sp.]